MAILKVAQIGHPVVRSKAEEVPREDIRTPEFQRFLGDMVDTMREYDGVGLAAPQVHVSKQVAVIEVEENPRYPGQGSVPLTVLINPRIISRSPESAEGWEGCLSVEGFRGVVPRHNSVEVEALDENGNLVRLRAEGFFARVIQHECDHLEGKVYLDRMTDLSTLSTLENFARFWVDDEDEEETCEEEHEHEDED